MVRPFSLFRKQAIEIHDAAPDKTRMLMKWRLDEGRLVIKVTNNQKLVKYKTSSLHDLRRIQRLVQLLGRKMENRQKVTAVVASAATAVESTTTAPSSSVPAGTGTASSKKKKKKGKK